MRQERTTPSLQSEPVNYSNGFGGRGFDESLRVEETKTMETEYVESGSRKSNRPVIQSTPKQFATTDAKE